MKLASHSHTRREAKRHNVKEAEEKHLERLSKDNYEEERERETKISVTVEVAEK